MHAALQPVSNKAVCYSLFASCALLLNSQTRVVLGKNSCVMVAPQVVSLSAKYIIKVSKFHLQRAK